MEKIRAIYIGDIKFKQCPIFELDKTDDCFKMIIDGSFSYSKDVVLSDNNFIVFKVKDNEYVEEINKDNFKLEE